MNKKTVLFTIFFLLYLTLSATAQNIFVFKVKIKPANPALQKSIKDIQNLGSELDDIISELRKEVQDPECKEDTKIDLAAFLLKKVILQRDYPYEYNEPLLFEASELLPNNFEIESFWGDILLHKGDFEGSINHYENALNQKSNDIEVIGKCGIAYMNNLNYEKALEYIETYLSKNSGDFIFLSSAGRCKFELNEIDEAIEYWEKALEVCDDIGKRQEIEDLIRKAKESLASTSDSTQDEDQRFVITFAGNSRDDLGDITFDMLNEIYYDVTDLLNCNPDVRFNVVFYLTEDYYKIGQGWSAAAANGLKIMIPLKTGYKDENYVKGTLAHEFTHTIINLKTNNRAPLWVHEGLAQYQEYSTSYGSPDVLRSDFDRVFQTDFVENGLFVPLNKVSAYIGSNDRRDIARGYVAAYMAIRCMADLYGEQSFDTLLTSLGKGKGINEAVKDATGSDYDDFQDDLKEWIKNQ
ncbi:MAG: tetratricopeptide repeat protein [Candidatus Riflebacteria bacterium]|nr:tetratricopeptide repeat protein [Candidatus Riflebacteria bacterium]